LSLLEAPPATVFTVLRRRAKFSFQQTRMATTLARSVTAGSRSLTQPADATNRN
jgi:hypothetical protein